MESIVFATIEFLNREGRRVTFKNRQFNSESHLNNWVAFMSVKYDYICDEVFEY